MVRILNMNKTELKAKFKALTGGLSKTEKMPCFSFNLSALHCNIGSKLVSIKNSVCYGCYAMKGNYLRYKDNLSKSYKNKSDAYNNDSKQWEDNFILYFNSFYYFNSHAYRNYNRYNDNMTNN